MGNVERLQHWLKHYREWKAFIRNNGQMIANYQKEMELEAAPGTAHYGPEAPGGGSFQSQEEAALLRKERLQARITALQARGQAANTKTMAIENALEEMEPEGREIIQKRDIEGKQWAAVAAAFGYSDSAIRRKHKALLQEMAGIIFGDTVEV